MIHLEVAVFSEVRAPDQAFWPLTAGMSCLLGVAWPYWISVITHTLGRTLSPANIPQMPSDMSSLSLQAE